MRSLKFLVTLVIVLTVALTVPQLSLGQYSITTVAGGGPNNLNALQTGIGYAASVVQDSLGNTYISDAWSSQVFKVDSSGVLTIYAGNSIFGYSGDGGPATSAALNNPEGLALDASGNLYIADTGNSVIREVLASDSTIQTVAGNATVGYAGDGGSATAAELNDPYGVFVDGSGNLFIADTSNCLIRKVSGGNISTVAGTPDTIATQPCSYAGDGGPATNALLNQPYGVFVDGAGNIYIADTNNSLIRVVNPGSQPATIANITIPAGDIQTVAGIQYDSSDGDSCQFTGDNGAATSAYLCQPQGVFVDGSGNIYIADNANFAVREVVTGGNISTIAGTLGSEGYSGDGSTATSATLSGPTGIFLDSSSDIFIADDLNSAIREVSGGNISTFAGNTTLGWSGDGGSATSAALNSPFGVFVDGAGNLYIADTYNSAIREVSAANGNIQTLAGIGRPCFTNSCGDGSTAITARLDQPYGVFLYSGNIYVADTQNSAIRVINPGASAINIDGISIAPGDIQTVAGTLGSDGYSGDGHAATSAELNEPYGLTVDASGNIYIADSENAVIRVVNVGSSAITIAGVTIQPHTIQTVAGSGGACSDAASGCGDGGAATSALLNLPTSLALDVNGNIYIADALNNAIRVVNVGTSSITVAGATIAAGNIQTVAGVLGQNGYAGDGGLATSALLNTPFGVYLDSFGNIYIGDVNNSAIREVVTVASPSFIQTIAGTGVPGFSGDGGQAISAQLAGPTGVIGTASGNLYVAEEGSSRVRELTSTVAVTLLPSSATVALGGSQLFGVNVTGGGNTSITWQVNGVTGGNSTVGTISSSGTYAAPATSPGSQPITVTAISNANGFTSQSAQIILAVASAPIVSVTTNPAATDVYTGSTQTFSATVANESNTAVNWQVNNVAGGNSTLGTISSSGVYTAPATVSAPLLVAIGAVSQANSAVAGYYPIKVVAPPSATPPASQTISAESSATFVISLNANTGDPQQPITLACVQSTLPPGATCSFYPPTITPATTAVQFGLTVDVPARAASVRHGSHPYLAFAFMPLAGILLLGGKRNRHARLLWIVIACALLIGLPACGKQSNSGSGGGGGGVSEVGTYTIQVQGTTAAQPAPVTITTAGLTVQQ
jgi:hypothetical protein